jgi:hypothetical protein
VAEAVTGYTIVGDRGTLIATGYDGDISKPITSEAFVADVQSDLHRAAGHGDYPDR